MQPIVAHVLTSPCMNVNLPHNAARCAHAGGNQKLEITRDNAVLDHDHSGVFARRVWTLDAGRRLLAQGTVPIGTARVIAWLFLARHTCSLSDTSTQPLNENILYFVATAFFLGGGEGRVI